MKLNNGNCDPQNVSENLSESNTAADFLKILLWNTLAEIFLIKSFQQNLCTKMNGETEQVKVVNPDKYYIKNYKSATVEKMKLFIGSYLQIEVSFFNLYMLKQ